MFFKNNKKIILCLLVLVSFCGKNQNMVDKVISAYNGKYIIVIYKKLFTLRVIDANKRIIKSYKIGYGKNKDKSAKLYDGDNRTPEGVYHINKILSIDADKKSYSYKELRALNRVYYSARNGYSKYGKPGIDLGNNAFGPRFYGINYPNEVDRKRYDEAVRKREVPHKDNKITGIGFGIAIHGNCDPASIGHLVSSGCIRMFNGDIIELEQYIRIGTPVVIIK